MTLERIGPYRVVRKLGEGGMGAVLEAVQEPIGRRVAVKVLHRKYAQEPQITKRFFTEARAVNLIDHPGIVQISDYGQLPDGTAYLVMEYLKGETLSQRTKRGGPLGLPEIVRIARQIAAALAAAHEKNVFHRDLKPDNIMIVPEQDADVPGRERVKLLDFGIAKVVANEELGEKGPKTDTDIVMGTPRYMAPEQCRGGSIIDGKADVYSLGVVLYELLAGRPPFSGASGEVLAMHIYEPPPPLRQLVPHVPEELTNLVHRLLAKKREDRPSMPDVQAALEQLSLRHPTQALQAIKWSSQPAMASTPSGSKAAKTPGSGSGVAPAVPGVPSTLGMSTGQAEVLRAQRRQRLWIPVITFVVSLSVGGGLWRALRSQTPLPVRDTPPLSIHHKGPPTLEKPTAVEVTPLRVRLSLETTPPGAQVVRQSDNKFLGLTPWSSFEEAAPSKLEVRLHLNGYADKTVQLDRSSDCSLTETLEPLKKSPRSGSGGRPGQPGRPGQGSGGKSNGSKPGSSPTSGGGEQPRIVD